MNTLLNSTHFIVIAGTLADLVSSSQSQPSNNDPLIAHGRESAAYIGVLLLVICLITIIKVFSNKLDNAIIFALVLTLVAIAAFILLIR